MTDGETIARLATAFGIIGLGLYGFARFDSRGSPRSPFPRRRKPLLRIVETLALSPASALYVVKIAGAYFAIGRAEGGISILREIAKTDVEAESG